MKVNFTKEHFDKMQGLLLTMLLNNGTIVSSMGQTINVVELLHTTTINTLNGIRLSISRKIERMENEDEWVSSSYKQSELDQLKNSKELVNLIIGYKRYKLEVQESEKKREELKKQLDSLKESQKTPADKIKELEAELQSIDNPNF